MAERVYSLPYLTPPPKPIVLSPRLGMTLASILFGPMGTVLATLPGLSQYLTYLESPTIATFPRIDRKRPIHYRKAPFAPYLG